MSVTGADVSYWCGCRLQVLMSVTGVDVSYRYVRMVSLGYNLFFLCFFGFTQKLSRDSAHSGTGKRIGNWSGSQVIDISVFQYK